MDYRINDALTVIANSDDQREQAGGIIIAIALLTDKLEDLIEKLDHIDKSIRYSPRLK